MLRSERVVFKGEDLKRTKFTLMLRSGRVVFKGED